MIDLSILIPTLHARRELCRRLLDNLYRQAFAIGDPNDGGIEHVIGGPIHQSETFQFGRVEILTDVDDGGVTIGSKRNGMIARARGRYVCFFDDDDRPSPDYVSSILDTLDRYRAAHGEDPDCITFELEYSVDGASKGCRRYGIHEQDERDWPNHLTPIKIELARQVPYTLIRFGEDRVFWRAVHPLLRTEAHVPRVLYHYDFRPGFSTSTTLRRTPPEPVVVCLTTLPSRLNSTLPAVLESLSAQTYRADEYRLYLCRGDLTLAPPWPRWVRVLVVPDLGPLTKLSAAVDPTLPPDTIIVTADDDVIYDRDWLETLVKHAKDAGASATPAAVGFCGWSARALVQLGRWAWDRGYGDTDVLEGWAGAAYRRKWFDPAGTTGALGILDPPVPYRWVDDVWISSWLARRGIRRKTITMGQVIPATPTPEGQRSGLHRQPGWLELNREACRLGFRLPPTE
jgi:hypothetical protein